MIKLTDAARNMIKEYMTADGSISETDYGLRVGVLPGGCSGFSYNLAIEKQQEDDVIFESNGLHIFIDPFSLQYINGITIDYESSMMGAGFTFDNPNATGGCGCGSSFSA